MTFQKYAKGKVTEKKRKKEKKTMKKEDGGLILVESGDTNPSPVH